MIINAKQKISSSPQDEPETKSQHSNDTGSNRLKLDSSLDLYTQKTGSGSDEPAPSCATSTMMSTITPITGRDPSPSLEPTPTPSIASSRTGSRLLPGLNPKIMALLQNAKKRQFANVNTNMQDQRQASNFSSLVSDGGSFTISLDENELLPSKKTETFELTKTKYLEIDDNDASDDLDGTKKMPCCENLKITNEPAASKLKSKEHTKQHRRLSKSEHQQRQRNKRLRQHEHEQPKDKDHPNSDSMSAISCITFDFPAPHQPTTNSTHNSSTIPPCNNNSSSNLKQKTNHHHPNISTTTTNHKTSLLDTKKTDRLESIHNKIILLQTENHTIKAANRQLVQQLEYIQDPDTVKLTMMQDRVKAIDLENHNLRERNLDLETEVKEQSQQLVEKENMFRQYQQRQESIILKSSQQEQQHLSTTLTPSTHFHQKIAGCGTTLVQQQKEIDMQRNSYMTTRKKLEDKRKLCRDMLAEGRASPPLSSTALLCTSCRKRRDDSGGNSRNRGGDNAGSIVSDEEGGSFLSSSSFSSSMSLSNEDDNDRSYGATGDMVNKARAMVATQKLNQAEQEILTLNSKIKTLQVLNGNLLSKMVEQEDDFQSVTKMETSSIQQREEISSLKGQLKKKSNVCVSMEHQLMGLRTEMMDLKDMHEMLKYEYDTMKAEAGREVDTLKNEAELCGRDIDKLKNEAEIYKRKLLMRGDGDLEGDEDIGAVNHYSFNDNDYDTYDAEINTINAEEGNTMAENQNIMADFYNAKRYLQDAHEEAAEVGDDVVDTAGMEGLSKKEQEDLVAEIAEERKKWKATTSPPTTPMEVVHRIPAVVETIDAFGGGGP